MTRRFPFSAVVGQDEVKTALILNAVDPGIGGVLLRGHKGSGKSTLARGLSALLPGGAPFVELPVGATEDRVVGGFDLRSALVDGFPTFSPGLLHAAHGGVLYVDEVNLLPDHLVDVLLDVAASGVNRVERDGVSHEHPARFVLAGSMNPEEGELRPQLLDRFGLCVEVSAPEDAGERAEVVMRRLGFEADEDSVVARWSGAEEDLARRLAELAGPEATGARMACSAGLVRKVSAMCTAMGVEGLRADIVICRAAAALAAWEGAGDVDAGHVERVAPLALAHRARRAPLQHHGTDAAALSAALEGLREEASDSQPGMPESPAAAAPMPGDGGGGTGARQDGNGGNGAGKSLGSTEVPAPARVLPVTRTGARHGEEAPHGGAGKRGPAVGAVRGRVVGARPPQGPVTAVAAGPTIVAAAQRAHVNGARSGDLSRGGRAIAVAVEDLREPVRVERARRVVIIALDTSGSMGVEARVELVREVVSGLLRDAYVSRDRVAVVTFRAEGAELVLSPTGSVEVAAARMESLPLGGATPLAAGIARATELALQVSGAAGRQVAAKAVLVVVSDGRATAGPDGSDPFDAALAAGRRVAQLGLESYVVDAEDGPVRLGLAGRLAAEMGAVCIPIGEWNGV